MKTRQELKHVTGHLADDGVAQPEARTVHSADTGVYRFLSYAKSVIVRTLDRWVSAKVESRPWWGDPA